MSDSDGRRGIGRQLLTFMVVAAVVASAVGPALAATPESTWDGEVSLSGTPTDGTSYQYDVENLDSVDNVTLDVTGVLSEETDTVSESLVSGTFDPGISGTETPPPTTLMMTGSGFGRRADSVEALDVGDGHSSTLDVEGSLSDTSQAADPTVTLTGRQVSESDSESGTGNGQVSIAGTESVGGTLSVDKSSPSQHYTTTSPDSESSHTIALSNLPEFVTSVEVSVETTDLGSSGGDMTILDGTEQVASKDGGNMDSYEDRSFVIGVDHQFANTMEVDLETAGRRALTGITVNGYSSTPVSVGSQSTTLNVGADGQATWDVPALSPGDYAVNVGSGVDWTFDYTEETVTTDPSVSLNGETRTYSGKLADGETATLSWSPSVIDAGSTNSVGLSLPSLSADAPPMRADYALEAEEVDGALNPSVDVDGDGSAEVSHSGLLTDGETESTSFQPEVGQTWSVDGSGSPVTVSADITERRLPEDVRIGVNTQAGGGWANYSSKLTEGETVSLVTNKSWVQSGTNVVDVQLGDGSLSGDAPTPKVKLDYSHQAASTQSVTVDGEVWSERWETSRTWASARDNATLSIPFGNSVIATRSVAVYSNGSEVGAPSTNFDGTTLEVPLGSVDAGETTRVVANGSKVRTVNGSIAVTEPTPVGQQLDTEFRVEERSSGFHIDVGSTTKDEWLHYASGESWSNPAEFARFDASGGQSLYLPNAPAGGTARVSTLAVDVDTSQNVDIGVAEPGSLVFDVEPGPTTGDDVTFNYVGASSGTEYELVSVDREDYRLSRDSGSTAILRDDDSPETLQIRPINSSGSTTELQDIGGGGSGIPPAVDPRANPYALLALSGIVIMGGVGVAAWRPSIPMWAVVPLLVPVTLVVIATQSPGTLRQLVAGRFGAALQQVGPALLLLGGTVVSYVIYKLAQKLGPDKKVFNFRGGSK